MRLLKPELIAAIQKAEFIAQVQFCGAGYLDYGHSVFPCISWSETEDIIWTRRHNMPDHFLVLNGLHLKHLAQTLYDYCHISWSEKELIMAGWYGRAPGSGG